jgi:hypothetical protein
MNNNTSDFGSPAKVRMQFLAVSRKQKEIDPIKPALEKK